MTSPVGTIKSATPAGGLLEAVLRGPLPEGTDVPSDEAVWNVVDELPKRLSLVLSLRYGREGQVATQDAVADALAHIEGRRLSRERIRQLQQKGLQRLRHPRYRTLLVGNLKPFPKVPTTFSAIGSRHGPAAGAAPGQSVGAAARSILSVMFRGDPPPDAVRLSDRAVWAEVDMLTRKQSLVLSLGWGRHGQPATREDLRDALALMDGQRPSRSDVARLEREAIESLRRRVRAGLFGKVPLPALGQDRDSDGLQIARIRADVSRPDTTTTEQEGLLADQIAQTLQDLKAPVSVTMLTHLLRGSTGPATSALVNRHSPRHVGALRNVPFGEARDAVDRACRTDPRIDLVDRRVWLSHRGTVERPTVALPANHGKSWSSADELDLGRGWREGRSVNQLAVTLKRTEAGVAAALVRLGLVESRDQARARRALESGSESG